jgi:signal transduction histidine kinase
MVGVPIALISILIHVALGLSLGLNVVLLGWVARHVERQRQQKRRVGRRETAIALAPENRSRALEPSIDALADLKTRFILMISHEYRTPLTTILTTTELLERYGSKISEQNKERYTHRIKQSVRHLIGLLNDVLLLHQRDNEPLMVTPVEIQAACQDVIHIYTALAHDRLTLDAQFLQLPLYPIALDESLFQQILGNLLSNAIKFSPHPGTVKFELRYQPLPSSSRHDGIVVIRIEDQGIGIPMDEQPHIFDRFYRGTNIGTLGGMGLGLTLAQHSLDRLGGHLKLTSRENQGTIVKITLPVQQWKTEIETDSVPSKPNL